MTSTYERRIRKLEAHQKPASGSVLVLGIPGQPQPSPEEISQAALVLRVTFVPSKKGQSVEGGSHASH